MSQYGQSPADLMGEQVLSICYAACKKVLMMLEG